MNKLAIVTLMLSLIVVSRQIADEGIYCLGVDDNCDEVDSPFRDDELESPMPAYPSEDFIDEDEEAINA